MTQPMKVVYLDHTAKWSGGEIALWRSLLALDSEKVTALVALAEDGPFADRLRRHDVATEILPLSESLREIRKDTLGGGGLAKAGGAGVSYLRYAVRLARFLKEQKTDVIHCNSLKSDIYGGVAARLARKKLLWHVRDHIDPSYLPARAVTLFRTLARRWPDAVVVNSESTREKLFVGGTRKACRVVYDGLLPFELDAPLPEIRDAWPVAEPRIGLLGRIAPWKGQHVIFAK